MNKVRQYDAGEYDIVIVGAGHAGCEAGLASARMGMKTLVLTMSLDSIAMMPCNPSIGGTGKGHLVREIDALGGEMGKIADRTTLQSKLLNSSKGPAVHSTRAQIDKKEYHLEMKKVLENTKNLQLRQAEVSDIIISKSNQVEAVVTSTGAVFRASKIIVATGTYLNSTIFIGDARLRSGPNSLSGSYSLSDNLLKKGFSLNRFKTGTPARVDSNTLNYDLMEIQLGDKWPLPFSFDTRSLYYDEIPCWLTYTNTQTHEVIVNNIDKSGLFTGAIEGTGARYCPSIETKVFRFADKERHQLFIEPEGANTTESYVQGMSTSMGEDVQLEFMHTIPGLENCRIMRPAYAIEYDCIDPTLLRQSLEHIEIKGLYSAGQFNGTSGYEEAAAQGLIAGINASLAIMNKPPFILDRSEAYIGVLIDDLVTKGIDEPYRMMTSKAEYRLILRQDNADLRLTEYGYNYGLISSDRYEAFSDYKRNYENELERIKTTRIKPDILNPFLQNLGDQPVDQSKYLSELLKRENIDYDTLTTIDKERPLFIDERIADQININFRYEGYINKQIQQIRSFKSSENNKIPEDTDYAKIKGLRIEATEKLIAVQPTSVGQAGRIPGVSPADIAVLLVYLEQIRRKR